MTDVRLATHPSEFDALPSSALRERFLVDGLFAPGDVRFCLSQGDRVLIGGAMPAGQTLEIVAPEEVRAEALCDRRELGVVCLAGPGLVTTDGTEYVMNAEDILYVGAGTQSITVSGEATYYLVSVPAHRQLPTTLIPRDQADLVEVGEDAAASKRTIRKYVHGERVASCELAIGITTLAPGSVWNTMPCHTHDRRTETYLYFDLPENERVIHLCGQPSGTRSIVVADRQAVISPPWSVHFGAGTAPYKFVWATGGENLAYNDMDPVATASLS
jgi:4-deoxy-L-threo-5-hexosulose-uronate ketol-isomerase